MSITKSQFYVKKKWLWACESCLYTFSLQCDGKEIGYCEWSCRVWIECLSHYCTEHSSWCEQGLIITNAVYLNELRVQKRLLKSQTP